MKYEKIIIAVSKPIFKLKKKEDNMGHVFMDDDETVGKMIFIADKKKYQEWCLWMKENKQWEQMNEIYIYDRTHVSGEDMIERATMMLHKYSYVITLKDKFKKCWFNGEVDGCKLFPEHAIDPENKYW